MEYFGLRTKSFLVIILKMLFLVRSATLFTEIMPRTSTPQGCLFRRHKRKLTRSVNSEYAVRQTSRANAYEGEGHNFFQRVNSNPNLE